MEAEVMTSKEAVLEAIDGLFEEELAEIREAHAERERRLKAHEEAQAELAGLRRSLRHCEESLVGLPERVIVERPEDSDATVERELLKEYRRLVKERAELGERLKAAEEHAKGVQADDRRESQRLFRLVGEIHDRAIERRKEIERALEQEFAPVAGEREAARKIVQASHG